MKATGIVRRIEACVIIGQTAPNPHKRKGFRPICFAQNILLHNKSEVISPRFLTFEQIIITCESFRFPLPCVERL